MSVNKKRISLLRVRMLPFDASQFQVGSKSRAVYYYYFWLCLARLPPPLPMVGWLVGLLGTFVNKLALRQTDTLLCVRACERSVCGVQTKAFMCYVLMHF